ncbi:MAG: sugar kinase [Planctomycetes bacterium]|nr:sugar kinase [Planctomycetota bacterium]
MAHSLLVVGSIAFDSVRTPHGEAADVLGGSATYFSVAASFFAPVRLVGVVGDDFPPEHLEALASRRIDMAGLQRVPGGKTFRWRGSYEGSMNEARTEDVQLNVFGDFKPVIPEAFRTSELVFLANGSPVTQMSVLDQVEKPALVVADTMNLWIDTQPDALRQLLGRVDGLVLNDGEARMLTGETDLAKAEARVLEMGPKFVVVKRGSEGARLAGRDLGPGASGRPGAVRLSLPAYRGADVRDPTGAGDSFAGGMMGCLAGLDHDIDFQDMGTALEYATVTASFTIEDFSTRRLDRLTIDEIDGRLREYREARGE